MKRKMVLIGTIVLALVFGLFFTTCDEPQAKGKDETTYTVTFNSNGGSGTVPPQEALAGTSITLPLGSGLSRSGYTFGGWNTNAAGTGTNYNAGASYTVTGNVTLYAKWNSGSSGGNTVITLVYNEYGEASSYWQTAVGIDSFLNGSKITAGNEYILNYSFRSNVAIDGLQVVLVDTSPAANYWNALSSYLPVKSNISANTVVSGSISFTATATATDTTGIANCIAIQAGVGTASAPTLTFTTFELKREADITYTVTFNTNGGTGTTPASQTVSSGTAITLPSGSELSKSGYTFGGWNTNAAGTGTNYNAGASYTVNGNTTLYAQWQLLVTYTVTFNTNGGTGTPPTSQTVSSGTAITLPSGSGLSKSDYTFGGWNTNSSGTGTNYSAGASYTVSGNTTLYAVWRASAPEGIYVGIISFAGTAVELTNGLVRLDLFGTNKNSLINIIDQQYNIATAPGTAMFYSIHKAMANLKTNETGYPANLQSVNIITFTDGVDISSGGRSGMSPIEGKEFSNALGYSIYVNDEIKNRQITDNPITAYCVGVRGGDVNPDQYEQFTQDLASAASPGVTTFDGQPYWRELQEFSQVQGLFNQIAQALNTSEEIKDFTMVTALLDDGIKVRMTFDDIGDNADASVRYIEGTIRRSGIVYTFTEIEYHGISADEGSGPITGTIIGPPGDEVVHFVFHNITPTNTDISNPQQFLLRSGGWHNNKQEYDSSGSSNITITRRSAIVYLVLDNSMSLKPRPEENLPDELNINLIRTAAKDFINSLYNQYYNIDNDDW